MKLDYHLSLCYPSDMAEAAKEMDKGVIIWQDPPLIPNIITHFEMTEGIMGIGCPDESVAAFFMFFGNVGL